MICWWGSRINTKTNAEGASFYGSGGMQPRENFRILATKSHVSWVSEKFRQDICQILTSKVLFFFMKNVYSVFMKNLTDFCKTMKTCLDPAPDLQDISVSQNFKTLSSVNRSHTSISSCRFWWKLDQDFDSSRDWDYLRRTRWTSSTGKGLYMLRTA